MTKQVRSKDGTTIAYERTGSGPALILVDGACCHRRFGPSGALAPQLEPNFTVYRYDRRGRGESGDTQPYAVDREIEDLEALVREAGGSAHVCGISSGAALALEAAARGVGVTKLALYEAPYIVDDSRAPLGDDYRRQLDAGIASGRRGDTVKAFMTAVGVPAFGIAIMRLLPAWSKLKAIAHTIPYDAAIMRDTQQGKPLPTARWASATMPTLVIVGGNSPTWMKNGMRALADALPKAEHRTLEGQTHMVKAKVLAPVLAEFFR